MYKNRFVMQKPNIKSITAPVYFRTVLYAQVFPKTEHARVSLFISGLVFFGSIPVETEKENYQTVEPLLQTANEP